MDRSGAVRSIQAANVDMPEDELDKLWSAQSLERLARTYWWYLSRVTLGLVRVHYRDDERAVVFLMRPFVLLRFHPPEYDLSADRGVVKLAHPRRAARRPQGRRLPRDRRPPLRRPSTRATAACTSRSRSPTSTRALARPFKWFYVNTQSRIHVIVTHGFLKRLARLELEESAVGRFAEEARRAEAEDRNVGSTPWKVVGRWPPLFALGWRRRLLLAPFSALGAGWCLSASAASCGRGGSGCAAPCPSASASRATRSSRRARPGSGRPAGRRRR